MFSIDSTYKQNIGPIFPDDPMRGIRPSWMTDDEFEEVKVPPLPKRSKIWYISSTGRFDWYIPAILESYISTGSVITGYVLSIDDPKYNDLKTQKRVAEIEEEIKSVDPINVIERWDGEIPPCPVQGLEGATNLPSNAFGNDFSDEMKKKSEERFLQAKIRCGNNLGFQGARQNGLGPEMWGITLQQLQAIIQDPAFKKSVTAQYGGERISGGMSMYEVVQQIFMKKTAGTGMGFALLINKDKPLRARVMVSHAWSEDYEHFVKSLETSRLQGPFWVCAASIYQSEDIGKVSIAKQLGPDPSTGPFATVLKQADKMVCVITPECDIYTRLWCVFEMYVAVSLGVAVEMAYFSESTGWGGSGQTYFNAGMDSAHKIIDTKKASCSVDSDKRMIHDEISKLNGSFGLLDDVIYWIRATSLMKDIDISRAETTMRTPFGLSSASCASSRVNAAVAKVIKKWQESAGSRHPPQASEIINEQLASSSQPESSEYLCKNCTIV